MTGIDDFLLGYGQDTEIHDPVISAVMSHASYLSDVQLTTGEILVFIGIFLEGLGILCHIAIDGGRFTALCTYLSRGHFQIHLAGTGWVSSECRSCKSCI
ncbi:MAG: hypothetical protein LKE64_00755 [Solobacterium sp.]|jgi:hypothetical protein|nr:hypothetical protein [Solobacterium sp.]MCH4050031.1 hypothetical protein [Solobacterium sp.]MCH4073716.1 hypothetical protein [Solobacterium sp.]MCI1313205.1 hypothetical protein [Solobacterium sp.]MCI1346699.1 hypothetical protein [Solobacterium sp.]